VWVAREAGNPVGLVLHDPRESVASIFTRSAELAERLFRQCRESQVYSELDLKAPRERFRIYAAHITPGEPDHRFRHRIRVAEDRDLAAVKRLLKELYGELNERWFSGAIGLEETGFIAEMGGALAGVAFASVIGAHGRLHSLAVRPGYRGMGIGLDLLFARRIWAQRAGARDLLSEISEHNLPSQKVAERGGMRPVGQIFLYRRT